MGKRNWKTEALLLQLATGNKTHKAYVYPWILQSPISLGQQGYNPRYTRTRNTFTSTLTSSHFLSGNSGRSPLPHLTVWRWSSCIYQLACAFPIPTFILRFHQNSPFSPASHFCPSYSHPLTSHPPSYQLTSINPILSSLIQPTYTLFISGRSHPHIHILPTLAMPFLKLMKLTSW